jgi:hypothetical protein
MTLSPNANLSVIKAWLDKNMLEEKCIKACCQEVSKIPQTKGIYFWFMKKSSYKEISNIMTIKPNEAALSRSINGSKYDLVYVGTAGARNNSNGQNTGNLQERLKWHLCNNKNISSLCNGTMSTFRRTLGALLASDLIENDLQKNLDKILCKNFYIYYIEYPGSFGDVKNGIAQHEEILINTLRPIFNLSKNPNTANSKHTTHLIQERRRLIEAISKEKHCLPMKANVNQKSLSTTKAKPIQTKEDKFCIEFKIKKTENISEVASKIKNLPDGPCSIELYSENKKDVRTYVNSRLRLIRTSNRTVSQYFNAPDTKNGNVAKWHIVQNEMNDKKKPIEVITVRVCRILDLLPSSEMTAMKKNQTVSIKKNSDSAVGKNAKIMKSKKTKLLIIGCCDAKSLQPNNLNNGNKVNYNFGEPLENSRQARNQIYQQLDATYFIGKTRNNIEVDQNYFLNALNRNNRREALDVYGNNYSPFFKPQMKQLYRQKILSSNLQVLIISGLYGLLKHDDYINDYHLEINKGQNVWGNCISDAIKAYIKKNNIDDKLVYYSLSNNYLTFLGPAHPNWTNLWENHPGRGHAQAEDLAIFLNQL